MEFIISLFLTVVICIYIVFPFLNGYYNKNKPKNTIIKTFSFFVLFLVFTITLISMDNTTNTTKKELSKEEYFAENKKNIISLLELRLKEQKFSVIQETLERYKTIKDKDLESFKNSYYVKIDKIEQNEIVEINLKVSCGEKEAYQIALKKAIEKYPIMKKSTVYDYKVMKTAYGYAYTIYFNKTTDATNADMVLVTINNNCEILHVTAPTKSTFYLKSKNKCITKGTILGDNHELLVNYCDKNVQFKASNDALSRNFTKNEISKIKKIFNTANTKYSTFSDRQVLYKTNNLKIWVRIYSSSKWFLVFDFDSIEPYPASPNASVWIGSDKLKEFTKLLE